MSIARVMPGQVVVVGDGQIGALAAVMLRQALPATAITVVGTPPDPAAFADRIGTALPYTNRLHDRFGIAEQDIIRHAGGSHRLVTCYVGWADGGRDGFAAYGDHVDPRTRTAFAREWGGGTRTSMARMPAGSIAEALAMAGRFALPDGQPGGPLADVDYGLRWNVAGYRDMLVARAARSGVGYLRGDVAAIDRAPSGDLSAIIMADGTRVAGDLFIDCSGRIAHVHARMAEGGWIDWTATLPVRQIALLQPDVPKASLHDQVALIPGIGWRAELAGRDGTWAVTGLSPDVDSATIFGPDGNAAIIPIASGRVDESWIGNVIAVGDAACVVEPLGWFNVDLAHRQLGLLLDLLPGKTIDPFERAEYNRRSALMADAVRDVIAAHYLADRARSTFGVVAPAERLAMAVDQFRRRGRIPLFEDWPLLNAEWASMLVASGIAPGISAVAAHRTQGEAADEQRALAARCARAIEASPPYAMFLHMMLERG